MNRYENAEKIEKSNLFYNMKKKRMYKCMNE